MVWSQYVYEATTGFDTSHASDDDENYDNTPLNIEDWEVQYSDELWYMWGMINTLTHDAHIEHTGEFCDFVEFCYEEHYTYQEGVMCEYDENLHHIWKSLRRVIHCNDLHEEMMRGATFYHFVDYVKNYMCIY
jgi:hypothetical protein